MSFWTPFTYAGSWADFGNGFEPGAFMRDGTRVFLRGVITNPNPGTAPSLVATLPANLAPQAIEMFAGLSVQFSQGGDSVTPTEFTIDTSGNLFMNSPVGAANGRPVTLNNFSYSLFA